MAKKKEKKKKKESIDWTTIVLIVGVGVLLYYYSTSGGVQEPQLTIKYQATTTLPLSGVCGDTPTICPTTLELVCGDGITYTNVCVACKTGVTSWTKGKCPLIVGMNFYGNGTYRVY